MASVQGKFYAWSSSGGAGNEWAWVTIHYDVDKAARRITITGVTYNGDRYGNPGYWYVASSMKLGIGWSDGAESVLANGTYNWNWNTSSYYTTAPGAGFINRNGVAGIFDNCSLPQSHTFGGDGGSFVIRFGSTLSTINAGNPQSYRDLEGGSSGYIQFQSKATVDPNNISCNSPGVWQLKSCISGINWGVGGSKKELTAIVSYTFNGQNYSYTAGHWTDGATSKCIGIDTRAANEPWVNGVPAGTTATVTWRLDNGNGVNNYSKSVTPPAPKNPTIPNAITSDNPNVYRLTSGTSGITFGDWSKTVAITAKVSYTLDGNSVSYTAYSTTSKVSAPSFDIDARNDEFPWNRVPDDETVTITWTVVLDVGYTRLTAVATKTQYCQPSYDVFVINPAYRNGQAVESEMRVSASSGSKPSSQVRRVTEITE